MPQITINDAQSGAAKVKIYSNGETVFIEFPDVLNSKTPEEHVTPNFVGFDGAYRCIQKHISSDVGWG